MSSAPLPDVRVELGPDEAREMLDRQIEVLELIAGAAPLPDVLTRILTSLERLMPGARCSVLLLDREHGTLHHGAAPALPQEYVAAIDGMAIGDGAGSCGTAAALDTPVIASDVRTDPRWVDFRHAAAAAGLRSCWSTPIEGRDGLPVGTFAVYHPHPHRPSRREELLVDRFTHLAPHCPRRTVRHAHASPSLSAESAAVSPAEPVEAPLVASPAEPVEAPLSAPSAEPVEAPSSTSKNSRTAANSSSSSRSTQKYHVSTGSLRP